MGLDLYAGPLPRYLMLDWETPASRFSREHGLEHEIIYQTQPVKFAKNDAISFTKDWRKRLAKKLGKLPDWETDPSAPYEAWQLRSEGLDALILAAAHRHRPDLSLPVELPEDIQQHPAVADAAKENYYLGPMAVLESHAIVPGREPRICADENHRGEPVFVSTTAALLDSVDAVREFLGVDPNHLDAIIAAGPPASNTTFSVQADGKLAEVASDPPANPVRAHAIWGLACFCAALKFSMRTGGVILRDE